MIITRNTAESVFVSSVIAFKGQQMLISVLFSLSWRGSRFSDHDARHHAAGRALVLQTIAGNQCVPQNVKTRIVVRFNVFSPPRFFFFAQTCLVVTGPGYNLTSW
jgi:hypothetical protein